MHVEIDLDESRDIKERQQIWNRRRRVRMHPLKDPHDRRSARRQEPRAYFERKVLPAIVDHRAELRDRERAWLTLDHALADGVEDCTQADGCSAPESRNPVANDLAKLETIVP